MFFNFPNVNLYLEDINTPHHAVLRTTSNSNHEEYEKWVRDNFYEEYRAYSANSSYAFMCGTTFLGICNNFSEQASLTYSICNNFQNDQSAVGETAKNLKRMQRGVAGMLYRYLIDTGRNW